jgi:hypothetical protein
LYPDEFGIFGSSLDGCRMTLSEFRLCPFFHSQGQPLLFRWFHGWPILSQFIAPVLELQLFNWGSSWKQSPSFRLESE